MNVESQSAGPAVPVRPPSGPDGTRPTTGTLPATAVVVVAARAPRTRRDRRQTHWLSAPALGGAAPAVPAMASEDVAEARRLALQQPYCLRGLDSSIHLAQRAALDEKQPGDVLEKETAHSR